MSDQWRILIVEDEEEVSQSIVNSLRKDGYRVQGVVGSAAIRVLWSEEYDIVISDLKTPGADGFDLLEWVRAYRPNLRMIMLGAPDMRSRSLEQGAVGFVSTPLDLHALKEELRRLLQQTGFSASLDSFDLLDVIQIITMSRKDIALLINTGLEERGMLGFKSGDLVWADYGVLRGEEAFFALAAHKNGTVIYQPWNAQIRPNVTQPLSRLIFQALQYRSKYALAIPQTGEQPSVKASDASGLSLLDADDDDSPFLVLQEDEGAQTARPGAEVADTFLVPTQEPGESKESREWWEGTGRVAAIGTDTPDRGVPTRDLAARKMSVKLSLLPPEEDGVSVETPELLQKLPSWVTDQPTVSDLPRLSRPEATPSTFPMDEAWEPESFYKGSTPPPFESAADWKPFVPGAPADPFSSRSDLAAEPQVPFPANGTATPLPSNGAGTPPPPSAKPEKQPEGVTDDTARTASVQSGKLQSLNAPAATTGSLSQDSSKLLARRLNKGRAQAGSAMNGTSSAEWDVSRRPRTGRLESGQFPLDRLNPRSPGESGMLPIRRLDSNRLPPRRPEDVAFPPATGADAGSDSTAKSKPGFPVEPALPSNGVKPQRTPEQQYNWETPTPPFTWEYEPEGETTSRIHPVNHATFMGPDDKATPVESQLQPASAITPTPTFRRDYPSIVSALQSLGYALPGFVATALATFDGQPIAQVAVGELDISGLCKHFSRMLRSALLVLDATLWGSYEQQIIKSSERVIIIKSLGANLQVFLVLVTTAQTRTSDALEAIEHVEENLRKAL